MILITSPGILPCHIFLNELVINPGTKDFKTPSNSAVTKFPPETGTQSFFIFTSTTSGFFTHFANSIAFISSSCFFTEIPSHP